MTDGSQVRGELLSVRADACCFMKAIPAEAGTYTCNKWHR